MSDELTVVYIAWKKKRRNYRLLFGAPARWVRLDWQRSLAVFKPGDIFAYERWIGNKFGTQNWTIQVLKAGQSGMEISCVQGVKPGAHILHSSRGKQACKNMLGRFDRLKSNCELTALRADFWRIVGNELEVNHQFDPDKTQGR